MRRFMTFILTMIIVLTGCGAEKAKTDTSENSEFIPQVMECKENEKVVLSAGDTEIFFIMPVDCVLTERNPAENNMVKYLPGFTGLEKVWEISVDGNPIGAVGATHYELNSDPPRLMDIYGEIALPNNYNFSVHTKEEMEDTGYYKSIKEENNTVCAVTKVYYSSQIADSVGYGRTSGYNDGILAHNSDRMVFVAFDIESNYFLSDTLSEIAGSTEFLSAK